MTPINAMPSMDALSGSIDQLAVDSGRGPREVAEQFEAVFAALLLKQMRQSFGGESLIPSDSGDVIGGMFDQYLGQHISDAGGFGVAEMLEQSVAAAR